MRAFFLPLLLAALLLASAMARPESREKKIERKRRAVVINANLDDPKYPTYAVDDAISSEQKTFQDEFPPVKENYHSKGQRYIEINPDNDVKSDNDIDRPEYQTPKRKFVPNPKKNPDTNPPDDGSYSNDSDESEYRRSHKNYGSDSDESGYRPSHRSYGSDSESDSDESGYRPSHRSYGSESDSDSDESGYRPSHRSYGSDSDSDSDESGYRPSHRSYGSESDSDSDESGYRPSHRSYGSDSDESGDGGKTVEDDDDSLDDNRIGTGGQKRNEWFGENLPGRKNGGGDNSQQQKTDGRGFIQPRFKDSEPSFSGPNGYDESWKKSSPLQQQQRSDVGEPADTIPTMYLHCSEICNQKKRGYYKKNMRFCDCDAYRK